MLWLTGKVRRMLRPHPRETTGKAAFLQWGSALPKQTCCGLAGARRGSNAMRRQGPYPGTASWGSPPRRGGRSSCRPPSRTGSAAGVSRCSDSALMDTSQDMLRCSFCGSEQPPLVCHTCLHKDCHI